MPLPALFSAFNDDAPATLRLAPIEKAPIKPGEEFGWCLLLVEYGDGPPWTIGRWDGVGWFDVQATPIKPLAWALLPT